MNPQVSAIVIIGSQRIRAQRCITALCEQQGAHQLEIVIFDYGVSTFEKLETKGDALIHYVIPTERMTWGQTRAYAVEQSTAPIIAFIEEHAEPHQGWLTAIMEAFQTYNLSVASYSFISGNHNNYVAWAGHIAEYGLWRAPASKVSSSFMPWNNYAASRSFLISLEINLDQLLENDTLIYDYIRQTNAKFMQINDALVTHIGHEYLTIILFGAFCGGQLLAQQRVQTGNWGWARRITYAIAVPILLPFMRLERLCRHYLTMPQHLWELLVALPIIILLYVVGGISEGIGYIRISEKASEGFVDVEIYAKRNSNVDV